MPKENEAEFIKKLSTKQIVGKIKKVEEEKTLFSVVGICTEVKSGQSNYGEWLAFIGAFEVVNLETGKKFSTKNLFLPPPSENMVKTAIEKAQKNNSEAAVAFGYVVGVKPSPKDAKGYEFVVEQQTAAKEHDQLESLRASMGVYLSNKSADLPHGRG